MKKIIIPFMLALTSSMANAEYIIKVPLEQSQGGQLPNNSIVFVSSTEVAPETPVKHEPVDCLTNPTDNPQLCEKSLTAWEQFADAQNPNLSKNWNDLNWAHKGLSYIPNEPYPITSVSYFTLYNNQLTNVDGLINLTSAGIISLSSNQLTNVDGLINLTSAGNISLSGNQLTNVNGLSNLTSADYIHLNSNQLTNVNGLSNLTIVDYLNLSNNQLTNVNSLMNLTSVGELTLHNNQLTNVDGLSNLTSVVSLYLQANQLTNVNGIANVKVSNIIVVNATYSGKKLKADTIFCTKNPDSVFHPGYAQKSDLCESP